MARERCAFCGALNPADARWCGQCLRQFPPPDMEAPLEAAVEERESPVDASSVEMPRERTAARRVDGATTQGAFTVTEEGITWTCHRCDTANPLEAQACSVCGTTFAEVVRPPDNRPERDPNMAALVSLFLPGAGHMYLHLWPQGIARAVVSLWVVSVVLVALIAGGKNNTTAVAITFGIVATGLWIAGAHDAYREARREPDRVLIKGKFFLYLVLGLLMLLFFLLMSAGLNARA